MMYGNQLMNSDLSRVLNLVILVGAAAISIYVLVAINDHIKLNDLDVKNIHPRKSSEGVHVRGNLVARGLRGGVQELTGAGAASVDHLITELTTTAANQAITLADGTVSGQVKIISLIVDGGDAVVTPTTLLGGTNITFDDAGDSVTLVWNSAVGWVVTSNSGVTVA